MVRAVPLNTSTSSETVEMRSFVGGPVPAATELGHVTQDQRQGRARVGGSWVPREPPRGPAGPGPHQPGPSPSPCSGLTLSNSWAPTRPRANSPSPRSGMGERIRRAKPRKLLGQNKDLISLISDGKRKTTSDAKVIAPWLSQADRRPASLQAMAAFEDEMPIFYCWAWCSMARNILLAYLGQLSRQCPLQPLAHPQGEQCEKQRNTVQAKLSNSQTTGVLALV